MRNVLADIVLVLHFGIAAWIVCGLATIWIGGWQGWHWTRRLTLRWLHAGSIAIVAVLSVIGVRCPLTLWEDALRGVHTEPSFVRRWIGRLLYFDLPEHAFTAIYLGTLAATAWAWRIYPPVRNRNVRGTPPRTR